MLSSFPYLYADLIGRVIPGVVFLSFFGLLNYNPPCTWSSFMSKSDNVHTVMVPIVYAGLAYLSGTLLESIFEWIVEKIQTHAFVSVSRDYRWELNEVPKAFSFKDAQILLRATYGKLVVSPPDKEGLVIPFLIRFHAEAKMCFSILVILSLFALVRVFSPIFPWEWICFIVVLDILFLCVMWERLKNRARYIFRAIDKFGISNPNSEFRKLREHMRILSKQLKVPTALPEVM